MQRVTLWAGICGAVALGINRLFTIEPSPSQTRADAVGIMLAGLAVFLGLLWQRVQPNPPEAVELEGTDGFVLAQNLPELLQTELAWASHSLLTNTPTQIIYIYYGQQVLLHRGKLPQQSAQGTDRPLPDSQLHNSQLPSLGTIAQRCLQTQKPIYLANLALYPGRIEFSSHLPVNTQALIVQPIDRQGLLVVGSNLPRSYSPQDQQWISAIAQKLAHTLPKTL